MTTRPLLTNFGDNFITRAAQTAVLLQSEKGRKRFRDEVNLQTLRSTGAPVGVGVPRKKLPGPAKKKKTTKAKGMKSGMVKSARPGKSPAFVSASLEKARRKGAKKPRIGNPTTGGITLLPSTKILRVNNNR